MQENAAFLVLGYKQVEYTIACLDSILQYEPHSQVFFLDNGSHDGSFEQLQDRYQAEPSIHLFSSPYNRGVAAGRNFLYGELLLSALTPQMVILLDNDAYLLESVSARLQSLFTYKSVGAIGKTGYLFDVDLHFKEVDAPAQVDVLAGYFTAFRFDAFLAAKKFDEIFETCLYGGEDFDFCLSLKKAGYKVLSLPSLPVAHRGRASSSLLGEALEQYITTTNQILFEKWQHDRQILEIDLNPHTVALLSEGGYLKGGAPFQLGKVSSYNLS